MNARAEPFPELSATLLDSTDSSNKKCMYKNRWRNGLSYDIMQILRHIVSFHAMSEK